MLSKRIYTIHLLVYAVLVLVFLPIHSFAATTLTDPYENLAASVDGYSNMFGEFFSGSFSEWHC